MSVKKKKCFAALFYVVNPVDRQHVLAMFLTHLHL